MELLRAEAGRLLPMTRTQSGQKFLIAASWLPLVDDREVYYDKPNRKALTPDQWKALPEEARSAFEKVTLTEQFYYHTRYGSPMAYSRAIDLICESEGGDLKRERSLMSGKKLLDYGFGGIGHLRLLASLGIDVHGIEIDELLKAYYSDPTDTGEIEGALFGGREGPKGRITLHYGKFPADAAIAEAVGGGFDYIISKNTLKKGYVTPEQEVDPRAKVDLSVPPEEFLSKLVSIMNPGGKLMIYNISPKQNPDKFIPWADGRCPWPREMLEKHGLRVLEFDRDDSAHARRMGEALEWNIGANAMDLENNLFAMYTLVEKAIEPAKDKTSKP
jgi:hypothetical protein